MLTISFYKLMMEKIRSKFCSQSGLYQLMTSHHKLSVIWELKFSAAERELFLHFWKLTYFRKILLPYLFDSKLFIAEMKIEPPVVTFTCTALLTLYELPNWFDIQPHHNGISPKKYDMNISCISVSLFSKSNFLTIRSPV